MSPKEARKLVAEALRSGEYIQGRYLLCRVSPTTGEQTYCCLGVACEVYNKVVEPIAIETVANGLGSNCKMYDNRNTLLPEKVREWLGFRLANGKFYGDSWKLNSLAVCNDQDKYTFDQLADLFETAEF